MRGGFGTQGLLLGGSFLSRIGLFAEGGLFARGQREGICGRLRRVTMLEDIF